MSDDFYRAFEERSRGSRQLIKERLRVYLPFITPLNAYYPDAPTIDLGCGRGEWLELMTETGFKPYGIDLDAGMLEACLERGLPAEKGDAITFLAALPNDSQAVVTAFHVVEHISFAQLRTIVSEALRVLKPGGMLIMETPNPENIVVGTADFYLDPTHQRPLPLQLLSFLPEYYGFARIKTLRLQETKYLRQSEELTLHDVLSGVSPDYAIVAQKSALPEQLAEFDAVFEKEHGVSLEALALRYEARTQGLEDKVQQAEAKAEQAEAKAEQVEAKAEQVECIARQALDAAHQAEVGVHRVEARLMEVYNSRSWRLTQPLRSTANAVRWFKRGTIAWLTFAPQSRPRRTLRLALVHLKVYVSRRPRLKQAVLVCLQPFPGLALRLRHLSAEQTIAGTDIPTPLEHTHSTEDTPSAPLESLSPRARQIYVDLKEAITEHHKEKD